DRSLRTSGGGLRARRRSRAGADDAPTHPADPAPGDPVARGPHRSPAPSGQVGRAAREPRALARPRAAGRRDDARRAALRARTAGPGTRGRSRSRARTLLGGARARALPPGGAGGAVVADRWPDRSRARVAPPAARALARPRAAPDRASTGVRRST